MARDEENVRHPWGQRSRHTVRLFGGTGPDRDGLVKQHEWEAAGSVHSDFGTESLHRGKKPKWKCQGCGSVVYSEAVPFEIEESVGVVLTEQEFKTFRTPTREIKAAVPADCDKAAVQAVMYR